MIGGGLDFFLFRFQGDYVRLNLAGVPRNNGRGFVGLILPFCLRGCPEGDGFMAQHR